MNSDARTSGPSRAASTTLGALYLAQFAQIGLLGTVIPVVLRTHGATLTELAGIELLLLLPLLKVFWAPLTDRYGVSRWGHYRSWVLVLQPLRVLCLMPLLWLDLSGLSAGLVLILLTSALLASTVDTAVDALAFRAAGPTGLVRVNALQVGAGMAGTVVGGGGGLVLLDRVGFSAAVVPTMGPLLVSLVLVGRHDEGSDGHPDRPSLRAAYRAAISIMSSRGPRRWVWLELPLYALALGSVQAVLLPLLVDAGVGADRIGPLVGLWGALGGLIGVLAVVSLRTHVHLGDVVGRVGALLAVSTAALAAALGGPDLWPLVVAVFVVYRSSAGAWSVISNAVTMGLCRRGSIAADYAVVTSWMFALSFGGGALALRMADIVGYDMVLACTVIVGGLGAVVSLVPAARTEPGHREAAQGADESPVPQDPERRLPGSPGSDPLTPTSPQSGRRPSDIKQTSPPEHEIVASKRRSHRLFRHIVGE